MRQNQSKSVAKSQQRAYKTATPKTNSVKNVEVVTENVFVPVTVTKTIFTKKRGPVRCRIPKQKVEVVRSNQINSNSNAILPLLRKPLSLPEKGFLNATPTQIDEPNKKEKKISTRLMYRNFNNSIKQSETFSEQSRKKDVLLFPSAISDLPLHSRKHRQESPSNKTVTKSLKQEKNVKVVEKASIKSPTIGDVKRVHSSKKKPKLRKEDSVIYRLRENFRRNVKDISSASMVSSNASNIPTTLSTMATTPSTVAGPKPKKANIERQNSFIPFTGLKQKVEGTPKTAISTTIINYGDEIKFPVRKIASNAFSQVRCTAFDLLTADNFLETSDTDTYRDLNGMIFPAHSFQHRDKADYSILSFLKMNQSRYQDSKTDYYPVRVKYSWQVLGTSAQTSRTLLESLIKENEPLEDETVHNCSVKYSWQIIGIATQTSRRDLAASKRRSLVSILSARTNRPRDIKKTDRPDTPIAIWRKGKRYIILNNQCTQTFVHKESQTVFTEFYQEFT
ncbi:uncharacterized protein LOC108622212 [Ceratina calcarata]|uniref:Uncharacterized protein LOC108622212 n=1 Tax=Ceratina calcarata TaxID=156304 RepID=A0AAJ7IRF9_9HYME|nr:uncharacterized protein LOC108622212 [Ceratina calcarata]